MESNPSLPAADEALESVASEARPFVGEPQSVVRLTHSRVTRGVWRVSGDRGSAVLKVLVPPPPESAATEPSSYHYWLREPLVYATGAPQPYVRAGVRAPRLLARIDRPNGDVALWLEDVTGPSAKDWNLETFSAAARRLGRAQGPYGAGEPLPDAAWLSRRFLREYLAEKDAGPGSPLLASDAAWALPVIARHFEGPLRDGLRRLHAERERFLGWLAVAPRTFAHLDIWPDNLFDLGTETVVIDWGFAGIGAIGEDVGNLVPDSVFDLRHPATLLRDLDRVLYEGYLGGLRDAGWDGDGRVARLAVCASAVKYDWIAGATLFRASLGGEQRIYGGVGVDDETFFGTRAAVLRFLLGWADEARSIATSLGLA